MRHRNTHFVSPRAVVAVIVATVVVLAARAEAACGAVKSSPITAATSTNVLQHSGTDASCTWDFTCDGDKTLKLTVGFQPQGSRTLTIAAAGTGSYEVTSWKQFNVIRQRSVTISLSASGTAQQTTVNVNAQCVEGTTYYGCPNNATVTPDLDKVTEIGTDLDGQGDFQYNRGEACSWFVQCPAGSYVAFNKFLGRMASDGTLYVRGGGDTADGAVIVGNTEDSASAVNAGSPTFAPTAQLIMRAGNSLEIGFTIQVTCSATRPFGRFGCPPVGSAAITQWPGTIGSDIDGDGRAAAAAGSTCEWRLRCPEGRNIEMTRLSGNGAEQQTFSYFDPSSNLLAASRGGYITPIGSAVIGREAIFRFFAANSPTQGFTLAYTCRDNSDVDVSVGCPNENFTMSTKRKGKIGSDLDGIGDTARAPNSRCRWRAQCPNADEQISIDYYQMKSLSGDRFTIWDVDSGSKVTELYNQVKLDSSPSIYGNSISIETSQGAQNDGYQGFTFNYSCVTPARYVRLGCPAMNETTWLSKYPGRIGSDIDGLGSIPFAVSNCYWHIKCPVGMSVVLERFSAQVGGSSKVHVMNASRMERAMTISGTIEAGTRTALSNSIMVQLEGNQQTDPGFLLDYTCEPGNAYSGCPVLANVTAYPGFIATDLDGYGNVPYLPNSRCEWLISCPDAHVVVIRDLNAMYGSGDRFYIADGDDRGTQGGEVSQKFNQDARRIGVVGQSVRVRQVAQGSNTVNTGARLNYTCERVKATGMNGTTNYTRAGCPLNATVNVYPGSIMSDMDGAGPFLFATNVNCLWTVVCPAQHEVVVTFLQVYIGQRELSFIETRNNAVGAKVRVAQIDLGTGTFLALGIQALSIQFNTGTTQNLDQNGFTFNYTCRQRQAPYYRFMCPLGRSDNRGENITDYPGVIGSDLDGMGQVSYPDGRCVWTITCPAGMGVMMQSLQIVFKETGDSLEFWDTPAAGGNVQRAMVIPNYGSGKWYGNTLIESSRFPVQLGQAVTVQLVTKSSSSQKDKGFQLNYTCVNPSAVGLCPRSPREVTTDKSVFPFSIFSDLDGKGDTFKVSDAVACHYVLRCPAGKFLTIDWSAVAANSYVRLYAPAAVGGPLVVAGRDPNPASIRDAPVEAFTYDFLASNSNTNYQTDARIAKLAFGPAVKVSWQSGVSDVTGFEMKFDCVSTPGYGLGYSDVTILDATRGHLSTDPDGPDASFRSPPRDLKWTVVCPERQSLRFTEGQFRVSSTWDAQQRGFFMYIRPQNSSQEHSISQPMSLTSPKTFLNLPLGRSATVRFYSGGDSHYGHFLAYECVKNIASGAGFPLKDDAAVVAGWPAMLVISDLDGAQELGVRAGLSSSFVNRAATARWNVICPRGMAPRIDDLDWKTMTTALGKLRIAPAAAETVQAMDDALTTRLATLGGGAATVSRLEWAERPPGSDILAAATMPSGSDIVTTDQTKSEANLKFPAASRRALIIEFAVTVQSSANGNTWTTGFEGGFSLSLTCECVAPSRGCPPLPSAPKTFTATAQATRSRTRSVMTPRTRTRSITEVVTTTALSTTTTAAPTTTRAETNMTAIPTTTTVAPTTTTTTTTTTPAPTTTKRARIQTKTIPLTLRPAMPTTPAPTRPRTVTPPRERTATVIPPTEAPETQAPEVVALLPAGGAAAKTTTQATTAAAAAVVNPAVAAQTARAGVVLSLAQCTYDVGDELGFMESPTGVGITHNIVRYHAGAAALNPALFVSILLLHFLAARFCVQQPEDVPLNEDDSSEARTARAMAKVRFPGISLTFLTMILLQPTVTSAVITVKYGEMDVLYLIGASSLIAITVPMVIFSIWLWRTFSSSYQIAEESSTDVAASTIGIGAKTVKSKYLSAKTQSRLEGALRKRHLRGRSEAGGQTSIIWNFLDGSGGKWQDRVDAKGSAIGFTKRYGLLFAMYEPGREWFMAVEIGAMVACGVLDGLRSDVALQCKLLVYCLCALNFVYTVAVLVLRPYSTKFDMVIFSVLGLTQFTAAMAIAFDMNEVGDEGAARMVAENATAATMFIATGKSIVDLVLEGYKLVKRLRERKHKKAAVTTATVKDAMIEAPLLANVPSPLQLALPMKSQKSVTASSAPSSSAPDTEDDTAPTIVTSNPIVSGYQQPPTRPRSKRSAKPAPSAPDPPVYDDDL
jgi:hypothetical protein